MAEQKSRIYSLPEVTEINDDMYLMLDASDTGARRFNLKTFYDKVDGVQASADAANTAATAAAAAVDSANQAAQQAASAAESASTTVQGLVDDVDEALDAIEDISEQAVPLMSENVRGGAKLGTGLEVTNGTLSVNTTASGDGSQAGPILSLDAKGWAEQDTTTGKNLIGATLDWMKSQNSYGTWSGNTYALNGIAFTVNSNGTVTVNGTATATAQLWIGHITIQQNTTYTLSGGYGSGPNYVRISGGGKNKYVYNHGASTGVYTFTDAASYDGWGDVRIENGQTVSNITFYPQLELGSTATEYEPYSGGAPSPSPSFPQEIRVCRGRNLLDASQIEPVDSVTVQQISTGVRIRTVSNGTYRATKVKCSTLGMVDGETYTLKAYVSVASGSGKLSVRNSSNAIVVSTQDITANGYASITLTYDSSIHDYISLFCTFGTASTGDVSYTELQLERGSTPTPYVPYGYVGLEAKSKNLWKPAQTGSTTTTNGITFTTNADGSVTANGTATSASDAQFSFITMLDAGVYAFSGCPSGGTPSTYNIYPWDATTNSRPKDGNNSGSAPNDIGSGASFTAIAGHIYYMQVRVIKTNTVNNLVFKPQLEKGPTATPYEPYYNTTTPIPLPSRGWVASLPDGTADTLTLDGAGKVVWEKGTDEIVLNGSENWIIGANNYCVFANVGTSIMAGDDNAPSPIYATHFIRHSRSYVNGGSEGIVITGSKNLMIADGTRAMNVTDFKSFLAQNPVTVLYPLETPVTEECGYAEMPSVPVGAEISIPELDDLGVRYCVDTSALELARQWYEKARSEYAEELAELRMTVSELATRIS